MLIDQPRSPRSHLLFSLTIQRFIHSQIHHHNWIRTNNPPLLITLNPRLFIPPILPHLSLLSSTTKNPNKNQSQIIYPSHPSSFISSFIHNQKPQQKIPCCCCRRAKLLHPSKTGLIDPFFLELALIMAVDHDYYLREIEGKAAHDPYFNKIDFGAREKPRLVLGPVIVGAGPSGLAAAACLKERGVPSMVIERSDCIASLWQHKTYDRLKLHLPKQFCELPLMAFPPDFPTYPTKQQFVQYLEAYAARFDIRPVFGRAVVSAEFDEELQFWRVRTTTEDGGGEVVEYVCRWLIVATGENAEAVVPSIEGMAEFGGGVVHTSGYKSGSVYEGKKVLVVGCGNSGMEVCLDLCNHNASPSLVVRDTVHILPREMLGRSTFGLSMWLLKWLPMRLVDRFLLVVSWLVLGDTARYGLDRPQLGPLELKSLSGKTPVLDVGTLDKIKSGDIKVCPAIQRLWYKSAEFVDGRVENYDAIILATGYKSNVPCWLKESEMFCEKDGLPKRPFPNCWKGECGLYAVGFTKRGLLGASIDAKNIAADIASSSQSKYSPNFLQKHL